MALLRFTNPLNLQCYGDWDFPVHAGEFALPLESMVAIYERVMANHRQSYRGPIWTWNAQPEAQQLRRLQQAIQDGIREDQDVVLKENDPGWATLNEPIFNGRYVTATCPECRQTYSPQECEILEWLYEREWGCNFGRRIVCPAGHTLYACGEGVAHS